MQKFDTYSPEVSHYGDNGGLPSLNPNGVEKQGVRHRKRSDQDVSGNKKSQSDVKRNGRGSRQATRSGNRRTDSKAEQPSQHGIGKKIKDFFNNPMLRVVVGLFLLLFAAWLTICFISYVTGGIKDQALITGNVVNSAHVKNNGGEGGARLSEIIIDEGFGLASVVIVFWLVMISLKMLTNGKTGHFKTVNFTIKSLIALITVSLIIGLITIGLDVPFNLGGAHGRYVNQAIIDYIGYAGAALLSLFMLILFVMICLNDIVRWIIKKKRQHDARLAEKRALQEAEQARRREMEESARQDILEDTKAGEHTGQTDIEKESAEAPDKVGFDVDEKGSSLRGDDMQEEEMTYVYNDESDEEEFADNLYRQSEASVGTGEYATTESVVNRTVTELHGVDVEKAETGTGGGKGNMVMKVNVNHIATVEGDKTKESGKTTDYKFPPLALLREIVEKPDIDRSELIENKERIRRTLLDFGIPITNIEATVGPTVTLYEIIPEPGIKISSIRSRDEDIARSLSASGVRIIAPMPGKGTVGIEVPNKDPQTVSMRKVLSSLKYKECTYELPIALGSTISNEVYIADLTKMPHLLVAGATGQGKSVGLNAIIASLLYRKKPSELKFVMIDPKMVELSLYSLMEKQYLAKMPGEEEAIITDVGKVIPALSSLCVEMDARYELLKAARVRAVKEYNRKFLNHELSEADGHRFMPYIVVVVDEYSDLVMTAGKEIEKPIARLAQKARAIGIHLIVATQRPSTDVVTGMIKANFPARIAFKVSSGVDSKTILNTTAAQQLIGRGDMLISNGSDLVRVQCAFIDTPEVENICNFIAQQPYNDMTYLLPEPLTGGEQEDGADTIADGQRLDPLLEEVARYIINLDQASTSGIQRRFQIGYNRAGRIMDQLERAGVVGPSHGGKPRQVLVDPITLESILQNLKNK